MNEQKSHLLYLDRLCLQVIIETFNTSLATISTLFDTAEWGIWRREIPVVDCYCSGFYLSCYAECSGDGTGVDACWKMMLGDEDTNEV